MRMLIACRGSYRCAGVKKECPKVFQVAPIRKHMTTRTSEDRFESPAAVTCRRAKVLVVDDDEHFRVLARKMLEPAGFQVEEAESVADCLEHLRSGVFDAVIMDIVMPEHDGIEVLRDIKMSFPEIKIITVSGVDCCDLYLTVSAYLGADASLSKSSIASLCALLDVVLGG
jgi:CheY-like chemotaxis protein